MDPITLSMISSVAIILGKYALDKGVELGKEVGPNALDTAKQMFDSILDRLSRKKPETAESFREDPEIYQKPLEKILSIEVEADPEFEAQLDAWLKMYQEQAAVFQAKVGSADVLLEGNGAVAIGPGAVAAGAGGIAVGGNVSDGIHLAPPYKREKQG